MLSSKLIKQCHVNGLEPTYGFLLTLVMLQYTHIFIVNNILELTHA